MPIVVTPMPVDSNKTVSVDSNNLVAEDSNKIVSPQLPVQKDTNKTVQPIVAPINSTPTANSTFVGIKEIVIVPTTANVEVASSPTALFSLDSESSTGLAAILILVILIVATSWYIIQKRK